MNARFVSVYRSSKEEGLYLYVDKTDALTRVPAELLARFGRAEPALQLQLTPQRKLARADARRVLAAIESQGDYLQLPPGSDGYMFDVRANNHKL